MSDDLISDTYRELNRLMHEEAGYGVSMPSHFPEIAKLLGITQCRSILDYGSGRFCWAFRLFGPEFDVASYDPCVPHLSGEPEPADCVVCVNVLEHVEPEKISSVLNHINSKMRRVCYLSIDSKPAEKTLPDGRNAHLLIKPDEWWLSQINDRMQIIDHWKPGARRLTIVGMVPGLELTR